MRNQFFYTRTVATKEEGSETIVTSYYRDSFSLDLVIRTVTLPSGEVVVLLNDVHTQYQEVPVINTKNNKVTGSKEVKTSVQSEIQLSPEDGQRFFSVTNVEGNTSWEASVDRPAMSAVTE